MTQIIKGKDVAAQLKEKIAATLSTLPGKPCLAIIQIGDKSDDSSYKKGVMKNLTPLGIECVEKNFPETIQQADFERAFSEINDDASIHGILMLKPLPAHLDEASINESIHPEKDLDCIGTQNMVKLYQRQTDGFAPCTPTAVMEIINYLDISLTGKNVTIVGYGKVVGQPLDIMMLNADATVTVCNNFTKDLAAMCKNADIIVSAAGVVDLIKADCVSEKAIVIDVGINVNEAGKLVGDVAYDEVSAIVSAITPVPGGVGTVTNYVLAEHVVEAYQKQLS